MAAKRINARLIKLHHCYSVEEASRTLGVHKNTIRGWQQRGLAPIDNRRPLLFQGRTLREFLERQRSTAKRPCPPGTLYCLKCRAPRPPVLDMVDYVATTPTGGNLKALCGACETVMHRRVALASLEVVMPGMEVQIRGAPPRISGHTDAPSNCDGAGS